MIDIFALLIKHGEWAERTFGPGLRTKGITNHIRKELNEIEERPLSLEEWVDVIMLALDGARRIGASPKDIFEQLQNKHNVCLTRYYPFPESEDCTSEHTRLPLSKRAKDWIKFSDEVLYHIENYTVPQYGDKGEDQITEWSVEECLLAVKKRQARYGKNVREGQQVLDFLKMAHEVQMACDKYKESQNGASN